MTARLVKELPLAEQGNVSCIFCTKKEDNEYLLGKFYTNRKLSVHYFCLLFASGLEQKGEEDEGILGFLDEDILKEAKRGKKLKCFKCRGMGATVGCCNTNCQRTYHLPCGKEAQMLNQYFGNFTSLCASHRPVQKVPEQVRSCQSICIICHEEVVAKPSNDILWAPCCKKHSWFHRGCIQRLALSAGYFLKCPICSDNKLFIKEMKEMGIFVPQQDASWELEPNAFRELYQQHNQCDHPVCICPKGRTHDDGDIGMRWKLMLCSSCGSKGLHIGCGKLEGKKSKWDCDGCREITGKKSSQSRGNVSSAGLEAPSQLAAVKRCYPGKVNRPGASSRCISDDESEVEITGKRSGPSKRNLSNTGLEAPSESAALKRPYLRKVGRPGASSSCISDSESEVEIIDTVPSSSSCAKSQRHESKPSFTAGSSRQSSSLRKIRIPSEIKFNPGGDLKALDNSSLLSTISTSSEITSCSNIPPTSHSTVNSASGPVNRAVPAVTQAVRNTAAEGAGSSSKSAPPVVTNNCQQESPCAGGSALSSLRRIRITPLRKDPPAEKASVSNDSSCISIDSTPSKITCSTEASDIAPTNDAYNDSPIEVKSEPVSPDRAAAPAVRNATVEKSDCSTKSNDCFQVKSEPVSPIRAAVPAVQNTASERADCSMITNNGFQEMDVRSNTDVPMEEVTVTSAASNDIDCQQQEERTPPNSDEGKTKDEPKPIVNFPADLTGLNDPQPVAEVAELSYQGFTIKIFSESTSGKIASSPRFFFEPIVVLDPKSVVIQSQELFEEDVVRFTIQMWTLEIRSKVLELLRIANPDIQEKDVRVMPYEDVQLVCNPGSIHHSIKIMEEAIPYNRMNEKLDFFLLCDSPSTAKRLSENLRHYPEFVVRKWQLALECRGLVLNPAVKTDDKSSIMDRPSSKFVVSILPTVGPTQDKCAAAEISVPPRLVTDYDRQIQDLQAQIQTLSEQAKNTADGVQALNESKTVAALPVFSVRECTNPQGPVNYSLAFASFEMEANKEYGEFDLKTGIFTVKKAGFFQFNFTGLVRITESIRGHQFELNVDGATKAVCFVNLTVSEGVQQVVISSIQKLNIGQRVAIIRVLGGLYDDPNIRTSLFSCIFFS